MAKIENFRERIEEEKRKAKIEYDKKQQREFNEKLKALDVGDKVALTEEEKDFIWNEMDNAFLGDTPDTDKIGKWGVALEAANELGATHKTVIKVDAFEPRPDRRCAMIVLDTAYFFSCDREETMLMKKIMYLCDTFFISTLGENVRITFNFNNVWTKKGEYDV